MVSTQTELSLTQLNGTEHGEIFRNGAQCCEMDWNHVKSEADDCSSSVCKGMDLSFTQWNAMEHGGMLWNGVESWRIDWNGI